MEYLISYRPPIMQKYLNAAYNQKLNGKIWAKHRPTWPQSIYSVLRVKYSVHLTKLDKQKVPQFQFLRQLFKYIFISLNYFILLKAHFEIILYF